MSEGTLEKPAETEERSAEAAGRSENLLMIVVPPILVVLGLLAFVWWRNTANLDDVETAQLSWAEIWQRLREHLMLTVVPAALILATAIPAGILLTRGKLRRFAPIIVTIANSGQAAPALGLLALFFLWLGGGFWTCVIGLTLYGLLPVLRNTITGIQGVDPTLVEAGRGIGMSSAGTLMRIELPLAVPVIMAGVRTALVLVCGTAALAFFFNGGGLGIILNTGITLFRFSLMLWGAILIACLAVTIEWLGRVVELAIRPKGV